MQTIRATTVLDALIDFEELTGRKTYSIDKGHDEIETVIAYLDPKNRSAFVTEIVFFSKIMLALGQTPKVTDDVNTYLNSVHADLLNLSVFRTVPVQRKAIYDFLIKWYELLSADEDHHFQDRRRLA